MTFKKGYKRNWTPESIALSHSDVLEAIRLYESCHTPLKDIAAALKKSHRQVRHALVVAGIRIRKQGPIPTVFPQDLIDQIISEVKSGKTVAAVCDIVGIKYWHVRNVLIANGVKMQNRGWPVSCHFKKKVKP
jgi:hypothetical protein